MFSQVLRSNPHIQRATIMGQTQMRFFGVVPKLAKMELTVRTPYKTQFANFADYKHLIVRTGEGDMTIGNKTGARVYLLPPGEMKVSGLQAGEGNFTTSESGMFVHTGGWLFVHS